MTKLFSGKKFEADQIKDKPVEIVIDWAKK